jgi:hypothetical protein
MIGEIPRRRSELDPPGEFTVQYLPYAAGDGQDRKLGGGLEGGATDPKCAVQG